MGFSHLCAAVFYWLCFDGEGLVNLGVSLPESSLSTAEEETQPVRGDLSGFYCIFSSRQQLGGGGGVTVRHGYISFSKDCYSRGGFTLIIY